MRVSIVPFPLGQTKEGMKQNGISFCVYCVANGLIMIVLVKLLTPLLSTPITLIIVSMMALFIGMKYEDK